MIRGAIIAQRSNCVNIIIIIIPASDGLFLFYLLLWWFSSAVWFAGASQLAPQLFGLNKWRPLEMFDDHGGIRDKAGPSTWVPFRIFESGSGRIRCFCPDPVSVPGSRIRIKIQSTKVSRECSKSYSLKKKLLNYDWGPSKNEKGNNFLKIIK